MEADDSATLRADAFVRRHGALLLALCAGLLTIPLWSQPLIGHSQALNLVWHEGFVDAMRRGTVYPRWLETTNQGLGSPAFYFYAPLPFWVSSLVDLSMRGRVSIAACVSVGVGLAIWCSGLTMFRLLRAFFAPTSALIAAVVYMAMPYHLGIDVWWRAAVAEVWGFVWPPLMLHGFLRLWHRERWGWTAVAAATIGLTLSHLPSFLMALCGAGTLMLVVLVLRQDARRVARVAAQASAAVGVACAITAGYWLPALATLDLTDISGFMTSGQYNYARNFIAFHRPWSLDKSVEGVGLVMLASLGPLYILSNRLFLKRPWTFTAAFWFGLCMLLLVSEASRPLWQLVTPLQRIQFPWRFLLLVDLALVVMLVHSLDAPRVARYRRAIVWLLPVVSLAIGAAWALAIPPNYPPAVQRIIAESALTHADAAEYRTRWTSAKFYRDLRSGSQIVPGSDATDQVLTSEDGSTTLLHRRFFYPDLRAVDAASGAPLRLRPQPVTGLTLVEMPSRDITVRYQRVMLPAERFGWLVALAGVLVASIAVGWERRRVVS